ncbi:hypothetical protein PB2503_06932 [Parvularcula bermudensis HTCC2503]|uniref:YdbS-like PH domain-containing protein n=1 Tax=Parvularcula bermudensis (strain ATCC BAA-594 / HTCC2503 / KCTC 12087) TaxID=314260 RepID=E0TE77_PARBH|nr:PH domain-containing protein [Parvularcula bermudensis]ADM09452.1 hypothetical protein PB2503_06932 [Parvularcula bermudensis HTCC2503]
MSYVVQMLAPHERVIARGRFNWTYSFPAYSLFGLSFLPLVYALYEWAVGGLENGRFWVLATLLLAAAGTGRLIAHIVYLYTTEMAVTTSRFIYKRGFLRRHSQEVSLNKIEEINVDQSLLGRLMGFGRLTLKGTGVGQIHLPDIDNPLELRRAIELGRNASEDDETLQAQLHAQHPHRGAKPPKRRPYKAASPSASPTGRPMRRAGKDAPKPSGN